MEIVYAEGEVRLRKSFQPVAGNWRARLGRWLGMNFYLEAASLIRLRRVASVPRLLRVDCWRGVIEMQYVHGTNLRQQIGRGETPVLDLEMAADPALCGMNQQSRLEREFALWREHSAPETRAEIRRSIEAVNEAGVILQDFHLANIVVGARTNSAYIVDFESVYLRPVPGWKAEIFRQRALLARAFGR